jgi:hypothetical protein
MIDDFGLIDLALLLTFNLICAAIITAIGRSIGKWTGAAFWSTILFSPLIGAIILAASPKEERPQKSRHRGPDHASKIPESLRRRPDPDQAPPPVSTQPPYMRRPL